MHLRETYRTIGQTHRRNALQLPPTAPAEARLQDRQFANLAADRDDLDGGPSADNLEIRIHSEGENPFRDEI